MYKILGTDQKEYGPATLEQIIQWISEGRVDANTKAQAEGSTEWKPLSSFPEFVEALSAKAAKTPPPPTSTPYTPKFDENELAQQALARPYNLDPIGCISRSWDLVVKNFWLLVGASFVIGLIQGAVPFLGGVLQGGLFILFLKLIRGQKAEFADAFAGFSDLFLQLFLVGIIVSLLTAAGLVFCILPGIYLAVAWLFAIPLTADKKMDFWPAMEVSRRVITKYWWQFLLLAILNIIVCFVGFLVCCIGVYVAIPVTIGAIAYAYEDIFGSTTPAPTHTV